MDSFTHSSCQYNYMRCTVFLILPEFTYFFDFPQKKKKKIIRLKCKHWVKELFLNRRTTPSLLRLKCVTLTFIAREMSIKFIKIYRGSARFKSRIVYDAYGEKIEWKNFGNSKDFPKNEKVFKKKIYIFLEAWTRVMANDLKDKKKKSIFSNTRQHISRNVSHVHTTDDDVWN